MRRGRRPGAKLTWPRKSGAFSAEQDENRAGTSGSAVCCGDAGAGAGAGAVWWQRVVVPLTNEAREAVKQHVPNQVVEGLRSGRAGHDPRDPRTAFRNWCAEQANVPREVAEAALAHTVPGVEGAYFRSDLLSKRRALMAAWSAYRDRQRCVIQKESPGGRPGLPVAFPVDGWRRGGTRWDKHRMQRNSTNNAPALQSIYQAGGHFVLADTHKRPVWRGWQRRRPGLDVVLGHHGPLGIMPWSLSTSALDVDKGDPSILIEDCAPMAVLDSRRPGGRHLYYHDSTGRGNTHFEVYGCAGEVRSAAGYLILWGDGPAILADALGRSAIARSRRWPVDLFDAAGVGPVTLPAAAKVPDYKPSKASRATWAAAAEAVALERVQRGQRNIAAVRGGEVLGLQRWPGAATWTPGRGG